MLVLAVLVLAPRGVRGAAAVLSCCRDREGAVEPPFENMSKAGQSSLLSVAPRTC